MKSKDKIFNFKDIFIIVLFTSITMFGLGSILIYKHLGGINYSVIKDDDNLKEFISSYNKLIDNFYEDIDKKEVIDGAIKGMYDKVNDPYTTMLENNSTSVLNNSLNGKYKGVGISVAQNEKNDIFVKIVHDDSPAMEKGILVGDIIRSVNGVSVENKTTEEVSELIKKSKNNKVKLTMERDNKLLDFDIKIKLIPVPAVKYQILDNNIGYLRILVFNDTADSQVKKALEKLESSNINSLILDLRDNNGGYLNVCKNILEMFLEQDKVLYSLKSKTSNKTYKDKTKEKREYPISILINKNSASAAEILTSSLKESYGAKVYGTKSYGKGKVQETDSLKDGTVVKYTTAKWLTPKGYCIDGIGIEPDEIVEFAKENYNSEDINTDNQIKYVINKLVE